MTKDELIDIVLSNNIPVDDDRSNLRLVSEQPGIYSALGLVKELKIRSVSAKNAGISVVGIEELFNALSGFEPDVCIQSYSLKSSNRTILLYLRESYLVGFIVLKKPKAGYRT